MKYTTLCLFAVLFLLSLVAQARNLEEEASKCLEQCPKDDRSCSLNCLGLLGGTTKAISDASSCVQECRNNKTAIGTTSQCVTNCYGFLKNGSDMSFKVGVVFALLPCVVISLFTM
jgi:hypothetical protein